MAQDIIDGVNPTRNELLAIKQRSKLQLRDQELFSSLSLSQKS